MVAQSKIIYMMGWILGAFLWTAHGWTMQCDSYRLELSGAFLEKHQNKTLVINVKPFLGGCGEFYDYGKTEEYYKKILPKPEYKEVEVNCTEGNKSIKRVPKPVVYEDLSLPEIETMRITVDGYLCRYYIDHNQSAQDDGGKKSYILRFFL